MADGKNNQEQEIRDLEKKHHRRLVDLSQAFGESLSSGPSTEFYFLLQAVSCVLDLAVNLANVQRMAPCDPANYLWN